MIPLKKAATSARLNTNRLLEYGLLLSIVLLAFVMRRALFGHGSADYDLFMKPWYDFIKAHNGFAALKYNFSDYNVPYLYLLAAVTYLPLKPIVAIKLISVCFDAVIALFIYLICKVRYPHSYVPMVGATVALLVPTIFINSSVWGQCYSIYTAFSLGGFYFLLRNRSSWAFIFFGLSISFKLQAIFFFPLLFILMLTQKVSIKHLLWIPLVYLLMILPAYLIGRDLKDLLLIYLNQTHTYPSLRINAPGIFQWIPSGNFNPWKNASMLLCVAVTFLLGFLVLTSRKSITPAILTKLALVSTLIMPFLLPSMHERYFYPADVMSLVYAFSFPGYFYIALLVQLSSLFSYAPVIFGDPGVSLSTATLFIFVAIVITLADLMKSLFYSPAESQLEHEKSPSAIVASGDLLTEETQPLKRYTPQDNLV